MKPMEFKQTKILIKPPNMTDEECLPLPVFSEGKRCISCWKACWRASWKERLKFMVHGKAWIYVFGTGNQPPISIVIDKTIFKEKK